MNISVLRQGLYESCDMNVFICVFWCLLHAILKVDLEDVNIRVALLSLGECVSSIVLGYARKFSKAVV